MRTRQVDSVFNLIKGSRFIGSGTTGFCFLLPNEQVVKIYYDSYRKRKLFSSHGDRLMDFFEYIGSFNNENFYGPTEVLLKGDKIIGYIMDLSYGKTIKHMSNNVTIDDIERMVDILISNVKEVSKRNLRIADMHQRNIMYSYVFSIIDLDDCYHNTCYSYDKLVRYNMETLLIVITNALFKVSDLHELYFYEAKLDELYKKSVYRGYEEYFEFLEHLRNYGDNLGELRSEGIHYSLKHNDYYSMF